MKLRAMGAFDTVAVTVVAAGCSGSGTSDKTLKLGITLPLSGGAAADGQPTLKGAQLAVDEANAKGGVGGYKIAARRRSTTPSTASTTSSRAPRTCDARERCRPSSASSGRSTRPSRRSRSRSATSAGLLQCSPANTNQGLTKPEFGGWRTPPRPTPTRSTTSASRPRTTSRARPMADYAYNTLGLKNVLDHRRRHDLRQGRRGHVPGQVRGARRHRRRSRRRRRGHHRLQRDHHRGQGQEPRGGLLRRRRDLRRWPRCSSRCASRASTIPFLGPDGIVNGSGESEGSLINIAGEEAAEQLVRHRRRDRRLPGQGRLRRELQRALQGRQGVQDAGRVLRSRLRVRHGHPQVPRGDAEGQRQRRSEGHPRGRPRVRVRSGHTFETVLGATSFDANGDTTQPFISFYDADPAAAEERRLGLQGAAELRRPVSRDV